MSQQLETLPKDESLERQFGYEFLAGSITDSMVDFYRLLNSGAIPQSVIARTPVHIVNTWVNGNRAVAKCESEQSIGSFKIRGAYNAVRLADPVMAQTGIVASSAGNHAQGVALAAREFGYSAKIFMPHSTPDTKRDATLALGAEVELVDGDFDFTNQTALYFANTEGRILIPPFDHSDVIAGQGTVILEALEQAPETDIIYVPNGGGGFLAGAVIAARYHQQLYGGKIPKIVGVESAALPSMELALMNGGPYSLDAAETIAEGIAVRQVGELPYLIVSQAVADGLVEIVSVNDKEIMAAMLLQEEALTADMSEGAGAAALAGALKHTYNNAVGQKNLLIIDSGRNIDPARVGEIHDREDSRQDEAFRRNLGRRAALKVWQGY